jgi:hypothetical protein
MSRRVQARRVGEQLAQVSVIGRCELVLDDHDPSAGSRLANDIDREVSDCYFRTGWLDVYAHRFGE